MQITSTLAKNLSIAEKRAKYDASVKRLLANKEILAWIMKGCLAEYKDCTIKEIAEIYIEKEPEISSVAVNPDETNYQRKPVNPDSECISGMSEEDKLINEGTVLYDIRFFASAPGTNEEIKLIINIEAQNNYKPGYPLVKRGIYYCGRMLSAQYGTEFTDGHYEKIKKVYSIWICSNPPKDRANTITQYSMQENFIVGNSSEPTENYDMLSVIMINLGKNADKSSNKLLDLLNILISSELDGAKKLDIISDNYDITVTRELEGDVSLMCNLSKGILDNGIEKGIIQGIEKGIIQGIEKGKILGAVEACRSIGMSNEQISDKLVELFNLSKDDANNYAASQA